MLHTHDNTAMPAFYTTTVEPLTLSNYDTTNIRQVFELCKQLT